MVTDNDLSKLNNSNKLARVSLHRVSAHLNTFDCYHGYPIKLVYNDYRHDVRNILKKERKE